MEAWYAVRGLPPRVTLGGPAAFEPAEDPLGAELLSRGWTVADRTLNLTTTTDTIAGADPGGPDVRITEDLDDAWLEAYRLSRSVVPGAVAGVLRGSPRQLFASIALGGGLAQRSAWHPGFTRPRPSRSAGWPSPTAGPGWAPSGPTRPSADAAWRRTSRARLAARPRADGIRLMHLQVEADNATAIRLYERLGFQRHSSYVYLTGASAT